MAQSRGLVQAKQSLNVRGHPCESSTLFVASDVPRPTVNNAQVLVRIESTALNRADIMMREGRYPNQKEPRPLGLEGAGTIVEGFI